MVQTRSVHRKMRESSFYSPQLQKHNVSALSYKTVYFQSQHKFRQCLVGLLVTGMEMESMAVSPMEQGALFGCQVPPVERVERAA